MSRPTLPMAEQPGVFRTLHSDARHVWSDVHRSGVTRTVSRTLHDLQEFYLTTHARQRLEQMGKVRRMFVLAAWLVKASFLKLTPNRRVLLAVSGLLIWWESVEPRTATGNGAAFHIPFLGISTLFLILMLELKDKLLARYELEAGRSVQRALMPESDPQIPGWDAWLFTRAANDVGGDLVDYVPVEPGRFGIVLGDVAGKALPAALLMAKLQSTIRALAAEKISLAALGEKTNRILYRDGLPNRFATLVYVDMNAESGSVRVLNAGHMPPLVLRGSRLEELPLGAMALGMMPDARFFEQSITLDDDDVLIIFSDGLTEAMNEREDFFGMERLRTIVPSLTGMSARDLGSRVIASVDAFVGDASTYDDLSLVVLRRTARQSR